jgi:hypothetical protein
MTQRDLDSAVAVATGESLPEIRRRGFGLANPCEVRFDPEPSHVPPRWLDWEPAQDVKPFRPARRRRKPAAA